MSLSGTSRPVRELVLAHVTNLYQVSQAGAALIQRCV